MEQQNKSNGNGKKIGLGIAAVAILALVGITIATNKKSDDATMVPSTPDTSVTATTQVANKSTGRLYKDGAYAATGSYMSPGGEDQLGVSLTLKNDIVTDATVTPMPGDRTSGRYQAIFIANYKQYVVGKDIATIKLDKVSGSSLTGEGFNDALKQIEAQAKA